MGSNIDQAPITKGPRTKRHRPSSPFSLASSSSLGGSDSISGRNDIGSSSSPMNSISFGTEEEEDMANCLILLASGNHQNGICHRKRSIEAIPAATTGLYVYECKTCNRCFSSFQALGGHRASHKKPKAMVNDQEKKALVLYEGDIAGHQFNANTQALLPHNINKVSSFNKANKVHECSICGSEFSSGQALGGHMRRHRIPTTANTLMANIAPVQSHEEPNKTRTLLALDLNLPAPEEDVGESKFTFLSRQQQQQQSLIFSASPMVDCHY